jgi:Recombination endonuclease VII
MKICKKCNIEKSFSDYSFRDKKAGKLRARCRECEAKSYQAYKDDNSDKLKKSWNKSSKSRYEKDRKKILAWRYGLTLKEYDQMLYDQDGKCKICKAEPVTVLSVDHCHYTGKVRGLLCSHCNTGLGMFKDDPLLLAEAIKYLGG